MGMMEGTNARKNCIVCFESHANYVHNPPDWFLPFAEEYDLPMDHLQIKTEKNLKDAPLRCGDLCNTVLFANYQVATNYGNNSYSDAKLRDIRERHGCVVNEPLLEIHPSKQALAPLHNGAGLENHLKNNTDDACGDITTSNAVLWLPLPPAPSPPSPLVDAVLPHSSCHNFKFTT